MDVFQKFSYDVPGILGSIKQYTNEPYITNITQQLERAVKEKKIEETIYFLELIIDWYEKNQSKIQSNEFVINGSVHIELEQKIKRYVVELKNLISLQLNKKNNKEEEDKEMKIFISHSSKDKRICDAFVELMEAIGVPEKVILYTSSARHGISGDIDIFEYLRKNLSEQSTVFFMLSDNYYRSAYCLNEMGAAWIIRNDYSIFMLPNFSVGISGVIDKNKKAYSLQEPIDLIQFKNNMQNVFKFNVSENKWEEIKNNFLKKLQEISS